MFVNSRKMKNIYQKAKTRPALFKWLLSLFIVLGGTSVMGQTLTPSASTLNGCENEPIQFFANFPGATSYEWEFGDGASSKSNNENPTFSYPTAGNYTITLKVDNNGTTSTAQLAIKINPLPKIRVSLDPVVTQCFSQNEYCLTVYADDSLCGPNTLVFTDGELIRMPDNMPKGDSFKVCKKFTINANQTTKYDMTVEVTSCNGCTYKEEFKDFAEVLSRLGLDFWSDQPIGCNGVTASFVNKSFVSRADVTRFIWFFGDGTVDSTNWAANPDTLKHTYTTNGTFTAKLYVETARCADTFIFNAAATNFVFDPEIVANKDSSCISDNEIDFTVIDGPDPADVIGLMWNFGDNFMSPVCSGCNFNNVDYPDATYGFGKLGPFEVVLDIFHRFCPPIRVQDTVLMIGPQTVMEDPPNGVLVAQNHRYQCVITDTVQFTNLSVFYHNDNNWLDDDSTYFNPGSTDLEHKFNPIPMQEAYNDDLRGNDCVLRIWDFADPYAPKCTTNTRGGINVGKNCSYSMDTLPKHWYTDWDTVMAYFDLNPMSLGIFNESTQSCSRKSVHYDDSIAIIKYISPFYGKDSFYTVGIGGTYVRNDSFYRWVINGVTYDVPANDIVNRNILLPKEDSLTTDTIPLSLYIPGHHTLIKKDANNRFQPGDSADAELFRRLYFKTTVRCFTVELQHFDTCHPLECESKSSLQLALTPPNSRGVRWSGIRCLAPPSPPYGIVFNVQNTKPGCSQDHLEFNFDSAGGINNWVPMIGGLFPGNAPPPPPIPVLPYVPQGTFPTSFVYLYTANNITDRKTGWVTVGTVVGNGITTANPCYDTTFYHRMLKFRFANPAYNIERPLPRAQNDKAACRYDSIYFSMVDALQPDVETFSWSWGDGNRLTEVKKSYDTAQQMKKYFLANINNIEKYISDTGDLSGRLTPYAAYRDSVARGWTTARTFSSQDSFRFHLKLSYPRDSIAKWLADPNSLIGWNIVTREINKDEIRERKFGQVYTPDTIVRDTFLTSLVIDYKTNTIIAPEITPLIADIFEQLGFDYFDIPSDQISKFFGPPGSGRCIDTTGYSNFISFEYEETSPDGIKRFSERDTNVIVNWYHAYKVAGIHSPLVLTRTRIDGCVQISSKPIKVGFDKEIILSDTVLCRDKPLYGLANYWYWSTVDPRIITDGTDYWRDPQRIIDGKEGRTIWDWSLGDGQEFVNDVNYSGTGIGTNPGPPVFQGRFRPTGVQGGVLKINNSLVSGRLLGSPSAIYYQTAGVYEMAILAVDSNGCRDTTKQDIYVTDVEALFGFDVARPQCKTIVEMLDSSFVTDGCAAAGYDPCDSIMEWIVDWGDGSPIGGKNNANRFAKLGHDYTRNGTFTVKLIVNTLLGCSDTFEKVIIVPGPIPIFEPLRLKVCQYDSISFANLSVNPTSAARWILNYGDGFTQDSRDITDTFTHAYKTPGTYNVFLTQFDSIPEQGKFCFAVYPDTTGGQQALITIEVVALDSTNIIADDTIVCKGQDILFANTTPNTGNKWVSYKWIFDIDNAGGDSLTDNDSFITYAYQNSGTYRATVVPQYSAALPLPHCPYRDTITIYVDTIKADFTVDTTNTPNMCFNNTSFNAVSYRWWFDTYKDSTDARMITNSNEQSTEENPCFTYDSLGCYYVVLEATSADGCKDTTVQVVCNTFNFFVKTYNTFTPGVDGDLDGFNDVFDIPIEGQELYELVIYSRYGTKVFESEDANIDWNGKLFNKGADAAEGTYYYYLRYKEKRNTQDPEELFGVIFLYR